MASGGQTSEGDEALINERDAQRALDAVDDMRDEIIGLQQDLVRFDSVNDPPWGNEGPCQSYVADYMRDLGLQVDVFVPDEVEGIVDHPAWLYGRDYTDRPNVVGILEGDGGGPTLHLPAHADVVPIEKPTEWVVGPFSGEIIEGRIYGRGALDDKDGIAAMLTAVRAIDRAGFRLRGDVILSSYVDEEFAGGNGLLAVVERGYRGDGAINCDGVGFELFAANTGGGPFRVLIQGRVMASHPTRSMRKVQDACMEALTQLSDRWLDYWQHPLYPADTPWILKEAPIELQHWEEGQSDWDWKALGPACGIRGYATTLPGQDRPRAQAEIESAVTEAHAASGCDDVYPPRVEWIYRFMDVYEVSADEPIVTTANWARQRVSGRPPGVVGGLRAEAPMLGLHGGVPTVSFGVGSILTGSGSAHEPNERVDIDGELLPYAKVLTLAILDWCGYGPKGR
jgi:acetylornithine deacetylase